MRNIPCQVNILRNGLYGSYYGTLRNPAVMMAYRNGPN
jgi:hypothetical protein